jgi:hypothetical protein
MLFAVAESSSTSKTRIFRSSLTSLFNHVNHITMPLVNK